jgi:hypothetical protein
MSITKAVETISQAVSPVSILGDGATAAGGATDWAKQVCQGNIRAASKITIPRGKHLVGRILSRIFYLVSILKDRWVQSGRHIDGTVKCDIATLNEAIQKEQRLEGHHPALDAVAGILPVMDFSGEPSSLLWELGSGIIA